MNEKMESSKFCLNWAAALSLDHREALLTALCTIIDDYLDDPASSDLLMLSDLPPRYNQHYDRMFKRKFLVSLVTVGYRLAERNPPPRLLACLAEELALHAVIEMARSILETKGIGSAFDVFMDMVFEDQDYLFLYRSDTDGIEDSEVGGRMGISPITFKEWFIPFEGVAAHPYVIG